MYTDVIEEGSCSTETDGAETFSRRLCIICQQEIDQIRLRAVPTTARCLHCTMIIGDVVRTKRYDEASPDGVVSTFYREGNQYLLAQANRDITKGLAHQEEE